VGGVQAMSSRRRRPPLPLLVLLTTWGKCCLHDRIVVWRPILKEPTQISAYREPTLHF